VKPSDQYNGIDDHVVRRLTSVDVSLRKTFLPVKDCAALQHAEHEDANSETLSALMSAVARTEEKLDKILTFQATQSSTVTMSRTQSQPDLTEL
jgi:hypothetical protein